MNRGVWYREFASSHCRIPQNPNTPTIPLSAKPIVHGSNRPHRLNRRIPGKEAVKNQKCRKLPVRYSSRVNGMPPRTASIQE